MTMADATRYTDLCRICGEKTTDMLAVNIFENEGTVRQLDKKIEECLPVQVHEADQLPKMICEQCVYKLDLFFDFRERALRTENLLIHLYKQFTPAQAEQLKMEELMLVQQHHLLNEVSELELNQLEHRDSMIVDQQIIDMNGHTLSGIELSHPELIKSLNSHPIVQGNMLVSSANVMQSHRYAEDLLHQDHQMAYTTQTYSLNDITLSSDAIQDKHINQDIQDVLVVETNLQKSIDQNQRIDKREFEIDVSESQILGESYKQQEYVKQEDSNSECRLLIDEPQPTLFVGVDCDNGQEENDVDDDFSQPELEMCNICKTSVVKDEFNAHYKQHFVKCIVCSAVLPNKEALDAHSKDVHGDTVEKIKHISHQHITASRARKYNQDTLRSAIEACRNGMSLKRASLIYNVPRSTLVSHVKGWKNRPSASQSTAGRKIDLPVDVEEAIFKNISLMNKWGFGLNRMEILNLVAAFVDEHKIKTRFKDGKPSRHWLVGFCKRHNLSFKKPVKRQSIRTDSTTPENIFGFFDLYEKTIADLNIRDKPNNIFNVDGTSLCSDPTNTKVVATRSNTSVLFCVSASGGKLPPYILYIAKHLWDPWMPDSAYPNTGYAVTRNGWMTEEIFYHWFKNHFIKNCPEDRPLLLIFDGHSSYNSIKLIELARKEKITLLRTPPHTTNILQPLDAVAFGVFKTKWDEAVTNWQRLNYGSVMSKANISTLVGEVWSNLPRSIIQKSFETTGLYDSYMDNPINRGVIKNTAFKQDDLEKRQYRTTEVCTEASSSTTTDRLLTEELFLQKISRRSTLTPTKRKKVNNSSRAFKKKPNKNSTILLESSDESDDRNSVGNDSDDIQTLEDLTLESEATESCIKVFDDPKQMAVDTWAIVTYATKKTVKRYVGKIIAINKDDTVDVDFVRKKKDFFVWPAIRDRDTVHVSDIYKMLPNPDFGRRGEVRFGIIFYGLNLC